MLIPAIRWTPGVAVGAMLTATAIYGSNFVVSRYATLGGMTAADLVLLRFLLAGPAMLPVFLRHGGFRTCAGLGWPRGILLAVTSGAPMVLLMNTGVSLAPAAHGAALGPGTVTTIGLLYAMLVARAWPPVRTRIGIGALAAGLASIALAGSRAGSPNVFLGDLFFFATGLLWGFYPVFMHRWQVPSLVGAAICMVLSWAYVPYYLLFETSGLARAGIGLILFQTLFQSLLNGLLGLWLWGHAVRVLGPRSQILAPMIPVIGTLLAIPVLGEFPVPLQWVGLACIVGGLLLCASEALRSRPSA